MSNVMTEYLMVIKGTQMPQSLPPELQGKRIKKCSILEEADFSYSNSTKTLRFSSNEDLAGSRTHDAP